MLCTVPDILRKHVLEGARIDVKMAELKKELEAAKKLPAVTGYDEEQKNYYSFLSSILPSSHQCEHPPVHVCGNKDSL